jgi:hypothetical protein
MKIDIKEKSKEKHKNIIRALHPTLGPLDELKNLVIHPWAQK